MRSLVVLAALAAPVLAQPVPAVPADALAALTGPLAFVENQGQWPDDVLFLARTGGADAWVTADGVTFDFYAVERERGGVEGPLHEGAEASRRRGHVVVMRFEGGHAGRATGHGRQAAYHNYFLGDDPARWASRVPLYDEVVLESLYDGVDLRLYSEEGHLRYDLVVAPGADVSGVRMRMEGADGVGLTVDGALSMRTALGAVEHRGLLAYHEGAGGRREAVASAFVVGADGTVSFAVERADPARRLVIDPLLWATFLGGSLGDYASGVAVGADGSATVVGGTSSGNFPTVPGAYDATYNLGGDAFVTRLAPGGSTLIYSTYLGGMAPETAAGVALGTDGSATVAGSTRSSDFPTTPGAFDTSFNGGTPSTGGDAFVIRLAPDGGSLLYGTFLGGSVGDVAGGVAVGADGAATVAGWTFSADFPTTPGAYDDFYNADADVFVTRLAPDGGSLLYSTFIGSPGGDFATGVAVGADGAATVAGRTLSPIFPTTPGAFDTSFNGWIDVFVTRLAPDGGSLLYSTYLGGAEREEAHGGVAVSADGSAVVAGFTLSTEFPVTPGAFDTSFGGDLKPDAFVTRLAPDGGSLVYGTFLGGTSYDIAGGVAVGADGGAVVAGWTRSADFPTTPGAHDTTYGRRGDAFVTRLSPDGATLPYSTFLGRRWTDVATGVALGEDGRATVVGETRGDAYPLTRGAEGTGPGGGMDAFVARLDVGLGLEVGPPVEGAAVRDDVFASAPVQAVGAEAIVSPNPAAGLAAVAFALGAPSEVRLALYDVLGREVAAVEAGRLGAGAHRIGLDVSALPAGVYVWRLVGGGRAQAGRLTVAR